MKQKTWKINFTLFNPETLDKLSYIKMFIKSRLKLFWSKLYLRKDEFHHSLDIDADALATMSDKQKEKYENDLTERREKAHKKELEIA